MAKIRNDLILQRLGRADEHPLNAQPNAAGRPKLVIPLTEAERRALIPAVEGAVLTEEKSYQSQTTEKSDAMARPEFSVQSADVYRGAEIGEVDLSDWHGDAGQMIRVHAPAAPQVTVVITDGDGLALEQGEAARGLGGLWTYTTLAIATDGPQVIVTARVLPPHLTEVDFD